MRSLCDIMGAGCYIRGNIWQMQLFPALKECSLDCHGKDAKIKTKPVTIATYITPLLFCI
jgi:hypothetical protein